MCIKWFKKDNKHNVNLDLSKETLQWNKMWDMWAKGKIKSPYTELMEYLNGVNNGGHHCHFDNVYNNSNLEEYVKQLNIILPDPLKSNVNVAFKAYMTNPDYLDNKTIDILANCDNVYYENEKIVNDILKELSYKIKL